MTTTSVPVSDWSLSIVTAPPPRADGGPTFAFQVTLVLETREQGVLRVDSVEEFMAIAALLQIPGGRLFFNPHGQTLIKTKG